MKFYLLDDEEKVIMTLAKEALRNRKCRNKTSRKIYPSSPDKLPSKSRRSSKKLSEKDS